MAETRKQRVDEDAGRDGTLGAGGGGSNDVDSGAGAGAGVPDAETALRVGDAVTRGDVDADRDKLFPEARTHARPGGGTDAAGDRVPDGAIPPPKGG
ncbi:MAG TPA: hypothetical protein VF796_01050 [Humisphaera sp.]